MNTPAHLMVAAAVLSRRGAPTRNKIVLLGAFVPDASIFVFYVWAKFATSLDERSIWGDAYWSEPWQTFGAISNSVPLALILVMIGLVAKRHLLLVFALALLTHAILDFPLHADDAHRHFWPLTDWRFQSPISYWDPRHHGSIGAIIELVTLSGAALALWLRYRARWVRILSVLSVVCYLGVGIYFSFAFAQ